MSSLSGSGTKKRSAEHARVPTATVTAAAKVEFGLRRSPQATRALQKHHAGLTEFQKHTMTLRSDAFGKLNKEFQSILRQLTLPSEAITDPYHQDFSKVENVVAMYHCVARDINKRYAGGTAGDVVMFGLNDMDQLGSKNLGRHTFRPNRKLTSLVPWKMISIRAGGMHTVAVATNGVPWSWGVNDDGCLGRDAPAEPENDIDLVKPVTGFVTVDGKVEDGQIVQVSAGGSHSLFLSLDGNVYCAGMFKEDRGAKFKIASKPGESIIGVNRRPTHMSQMPGKVRHIESGGDFAAAILEDLSLVTWGFGHSGELGRSADMATPNADGGYNLFPHDMKYYKEGADGNEYIDERIIVDKFLSPKPPRYNWGSPKKRVLTVACGQYHILVVAQEPSSSQTHTYSAGNNGFGQLGHGDVQNRHELTLIKYLEGENIAQVAAGEHFSMALSMNGLRLFSFGRGDKGCLGTGKDGSGENADSSFFPVPVPFPGNKAVLIAKIAAGDRHAFALTPDHELYSWGFEGVTGHQGTEEKDTLRPKLLEMMSDKKTKVFDVAGGGQHSAAIVLKGGL